MSISIQLASVDAVVEGIIQKQKNTLYNVMSFYSMHGDKHNDVYICRLSPNKLARLASQCERD